MKCQRLSAFLAKWASQVWHFCPACNEIHQFAIEKPFSNGHKWTFDGNVDRPTFGPSMNIVIGPDETGKKTICHYWLKNGQLQYLADCTHALRGMTLPLPPIPERYWSLWK